MPIYEYACHDCEHRFETIQKAAENPLRECPACGRPALKKLLSAPVFRLKGSGWYETDFKTGDKRNVSEPSDATDKGKPDADAKAESSGKTDRNGGESKLSESSSTPAAKGDAKPSAAPAKTPAKDQ